MATKVAGYKGFGRLEKSALNEKDKMDPTLEEIAEEAEKVAVDQQEIAKQARKLGRDRSRGHSWAEALDRQRRPNVVERLRTGRRRLGEMATRLSRTLARGMAKEGESRRAIARRIGVSHQRVTALLNQRGSGSPSAGR